MTAKASELAQAEQRVQQARELEARLQVMRREMSDTEAKLGETRKQLAIPPTAPTEETEAKKE
jgi:hypothetical protein